MNMTLSAVSCLIVAETIVLVWLDILGLWWVDRYEESLLSGAVFAFLWGGAVELVFIALVRLGTMGRLLFLLGLRGPWDVWGRDALPVALLIIGLMALSRLGRGADGPADVFVYGSVMGAGFGSVWLLVQVGLTHAGGVVHLPIGFLGAEVLLGLLWGMTVGGAAGVVLGFGRLGRRPASRITAAVGAFVLALFLFVGISKEAGWLHVSRHARLSVQLGTVALLAVIVIWVLFWGERTILHRELNEEAALGVVPGWVPEIVPFYFRRIRSGWWPQRRERIVLARLLSRLAFRKHALGKTSGGELAGLEIVKLREHLRNVLAPSSDQEA